MNQAFADVSVLDVSSSIAAAYCAKLLADYGADVIKVEPPDGDRTRRLGPFPNDEPHREKSGLSLHLNTNKRGITIDLDTATGRGIFLTLVKRADVVVETWQPQRARALELSYEALAQIKPELIVTSITNFGQTGPYRDFKTSDIVLYAMGGPMSTTGAADREPLKLYDGVAQYQVGACAAAATVGALFGALVHGIGQQVDVSSMEALTAGIDRASALLRYEYTGALQGQHRSGGPSVSFIPRDVYNDPHLAARGFFRTVTQEETGSHRYPGFAFQLSRTPLDVRRPPVRLGEHNPYVYRNLLGLGDDQYARLEQSGQIGMDFAATMSS